MTHALACSACAHVQRTSFVLQMLHREPASRFASLPLDVIIYVILPYTDDRLVSRRRTLTVCPRQLFPLGGEVMLADYKIKDGQGYGALLTAGQPISSSDSAVDLLPRGPNLLRCERRLRATLVTVERTLYLWLVSPQAQGVDADDRFLVTDQTGHVLAETRPDDQTQEPGADGALSVRDVPRRAPLYLDDKGAVYYLEHRQNTAVLLHRWYRPNGEETEFTYSRYSLSSLREHRAVQLLGFSVHRQRLVVYAYRDPACRQAIVCFLTRSGVETGSQVLASYGEEAAYWEGPAFMRIAYRHVYLTSDTSNFHQVVGVHTICHHQHVDQYSNGTRRLNYLAGNSPPTTHSFTGHILVSEPSYSKTPALFFSTSGSLYFLVWNKVHPTLYWWH